MAEQDIVFKEEVQVYFTTKDSSGDLSSTSSSSSETGSTTKDESSGRTVFLKGMKTELCSMPFYLSWSFGISLKAPILNLTGRGRTLIGYAATHAIVIYDYVTRDMRFLQGHKNLITGGSVDDSGKWLVSADEGDDNTLIVWDTYDYIPINTVFNPHEGGTAAVGISGNAKYIVTVGNETNPNIKFWLWTYGRDQADDTFVVHSTHGLPLKIRFNPDVQEHVMITFERGVLLLHWDDKNKKLIHWTFPVIKNLKKLGTLTDSTYMDACHECVASTSEGSVVVFGNTLYTRPFDEGELQNLKIFVKAVKVSNVTINCIASADGVLATGDINGNLKFYDKRLRILYWCQKFLLPSVISICFNLEPRKYKLKDALDADEDILEESSDGKCYNFEDRSNEYEHLYSQLVPSDATLEQLPFIVRDFIIGTVDGRVAVIDYMHNKCDFIFRKSHAHVTAIDVHDEKPYLIVAYANGTICLYNYYTHELISEKIIPEEHDPDFGEEIPKITDIKYSRHSYFLVCGKENGTVLFLEPILLNLKAKQPKHLTKSKIVKLAFSTDSLYLAYYDVNATVALMKYSADQELFVIVGKIKSHYKEINDMLFTPHLPSRLFTIGNDRYIVEYDLELSQYPDVEIKTRERIEQTAIPLSFVYYPTKKNISEKYFWISDNQYKYKLVNDISFMCHSVTLGPAYGCYKSNPVTHMKILPNHENRYLMYSNKNSMGLQILPADGNPYKFVGTVGHPEELLAFRLDPEGKFIFTIGAEDNCVLMWQINVLAVESMAKFGGTNLQPYYCLIEGGINGWLFREMQDLFYYMQILHQGENTLLPRIVNDKISVAELPDLMRACGFYPSEYEIENMLVDIKYRHFDETNTLKEDITFYEFVQLYINYRPPHGVSIESLEASFDTLCLAGTGTAIDSISRSSFTELICERGEYFSVNKARACLAVLMHEEDADEENPDLDFTFLPPEINFSTLLEEILGIDLDRQTVEEPDNAVDVTEEPEHGC